MAHPVRNASPTNILNPSRIFFATTKTFMGKRVLESERNANLLIDVLRSLVAERSFQLHDFVIMPDHVHLLIEVEGGVTIEKAMQLIKGRFSHRLSHEFDCKGEVWQRGFTEVQVMNKQSFETHRAYIADNPVRAGIVSSTEEYPFCFRFLHARRLSEQQSRDRQGLKPNSLDDFCGPAEAVPLLHCAFGTTEVVPHYKAWQFGRTEGSTAQRRQRGK